MIIQIAEFQAKNGTAIISVERVDDFGHVKYYFLAENGNRSFCYRSLAQARLDIQDLYGKYRGFNLLAEGGE